MIIYKQWELKDKKGQSIYCDGYFLFGLIPLYIRRYGNNIAHLIQYAKRGSSK